MIQIGAYPFDREHALEKKQMGSFSWSSEFIDVDSCSDNLRRLRRLFSSRRLKTLFAIFAPIAPLNEGDMLSYKINKAKGRATFARGGLSITFGLKRLNVVSAIPEIAKNPAAVHALQAAGLRLQNR